MSIFSKFRKLESRARRALDHPHPLLRRGRSRHQAGAAGSRRRRTALLAVMLAALTAAGCGVAYQAGTRLKATRMSDSLQVGQTSPDIHRQWGEPDLRTYLPGDTEVWSYPYKPNSNDVAAALLYTSSKDGDSGTFLDLKFVGAKLVSWQEAVHTMPAKGHTGISMGINGSQIGNGTQVQPGAVHY